MWFNGVAKQLFAVSRTGQVKTACLTELLNGGRARTETRQLTGDNEVCLIPGGGGAVAYGRSCNSRARLQADAVSRYALLTEIAIMTRQLVGSKHFSGVIHPCISANLTTGFLQQLIARSAAVQRLSLACQRGQVGPQL